MKGHNLGQPAAEKKKNSIFGPAQTNFRPFLFWQGFRNNYLDFFGESGAKHKRLPFSSDWHIILFNNSSDLRFETHVQHTISFVQDKISFLKKKKNMLIINQIQSSES